MLGLITAKTVSKGRYGRSKEINSCIPNTIHVGEIMINSASGMSAVVGAKYKIQTRL